MQEGGSLHMWDRWLEAEVDGVQLCMLCSKVEVSSSSSRRDLGLIEIVTLNKQLGIRTQVWSADTANE